MLKYALVVLSVIGVALAAAAGTPSEKKNANKEGCYMEDLDAVIPFGSSAPAKNSCAVHHCVGVGQGYSLTCPSVAALPPCYPAVQDKTKPYPECCPTFICDKP